MNDINNNFHIVDLSNKKEEVLNIFNDHQEPLKFIKAYALFLDDNPVQLILLGKPKLLKDFQWQILKIISDEDLIINNSIIMIWNEFIKNHNVHSCFIEDINNNKFIEQLKECGFKEESKGYYFYFPFSVVYKITDLTTGKFYIGKCEVRDKWENGYPGSGKIWRLYYEKYKDSHEFKREILKDNFTRPEEMFDYEANQIKNNIKNEKCMNLLKESQNSRKPCEECGGYLSHKSFCSKVQKCQKCGCLNGLHYKTCPDFRKQKICEECKGKDGHHNSSCPKYIPNKCFECGSVNGHKKSRSKYSKTVVKCTKTKDCNGSYHYKKCPKYANKETCSECNGLNGNHRKGCSKYKVLTICKECGGKRGHHFSFCSKYVNIICSECGGKDKKHKKRCSKYKDFGKCPECGYNLKSNQHSPNCSKYKPYNGCPECGSKTMHKKFCSKYKKAKCSECGSSGSHKRLVQGIKNLKYVLNAERKEEHATSHGVQNLNSFSI